jgi:hypothetical protein
MKPIVILVNLFLLLSFRSTAYAQDSIEYVFQPILRQIEPGIPIADSLCSIQRISFNRDWHITKNEKRDILRNARRQKEYIPFKKGYFPGRAFVPAIKIFSPNGVPDITLMKYIGSIKPFYIITAPLFYHNGQMALINVSMVGSLATTHYLLAKKGQEWLIEHTINW